MGISIGLNNDDIELAFGDVQQRELVPATDANQTRPRRNYVYAHLDEAGNIFYVGKGVEKMAWSDSRHPLWSRYVTKHLNGKYVVQILCDNLSSEDAEALESAWIAQCGDKLVNWVNMARTTDFEALGRFHQMRDANRALIKKAKAIEKQAAEQAVAMYIRAIDAIGTYAFIRYETGLMGQLLDEEIAESGPRGELEVLDRLTLCLTRLDRKQDAKNHAEQYFLSYRGDRQLAASGPILKRVGVSARRLQVGNGTPPLRPNFWQ